MHGARHAHSNSGEVWQGETGLFYERPQDFADLWQKYGQTLGASCVDALVGQDSRIFHNAATGVCASKING